MGVSITVLLAYSVYLSIIADNLPQTSVKVCYLQVYLTSLLGITAVSVLMSIVVLNLHHMSPHVPVNGRTKRAISRLRKLIGLEKYDSPKSSLNPMLVSDKSEVRNGNQTSEDISRNKSHQFNSIQYVYCRHNGQLQKYKIDIRHIYIKRKSISKSN